MTTRTDINDFAARVQATKTDHYRTQYPEGFASGLFDPTITVQFGRKFARLVSENSVFCFVDMDNGNVRKAASWKTPAKHARGNIHDDTQGMSAITPYGAVYM